MKSDTRKTLFSFLAELAVYGVLVVIYFFLVLHFLANWLAHLFEGNIKLYVHDKEELDELVASLKSLTGIHSVDRFDAEAV